MCLECEIICSNNLWEIFKNLLFWWWGEQSVGFTTIFFSHKYAQIMGSFSFGSLCELYQVTVFHLFLSLVFCSWFWYLCSPRWIVFIFFFFLDKVQLHYWKAFLLLLNILFYCLPTLGVVISFILKSAMLINWTWPPRPITVQEWPLDHVWPSHLKWLFKCRFVGPGIFWYILKPKNQ